MEAPGRTTSRAAPRAATRRSSPPLVTTTRASTRPTTQAPESPGLAVQAATIAPRCARLRVATTSAATACPIVACGTTSAASSRRRSVRSRSFVGSSVSVLEPSVAGVPRSRCRAPSPTVSPTVPSFALAVEAVAARACRTSTERARVATPTSPSLRWPEPRPPRTTPRIRTATPAKWRRSGQRVPLLQRNTATARRGSRLKEESTCPIEAGGAAAKAKGAPA